MIPAPLAESLVVVQRQSIKADAIAEVTYPML